MTFENSISFGLGAIAINVPTPNVADIQTPLQDMFNSRDIHEITISAIKVIVAGLLSVGISKLISSSKNKEVKA